MEFKNINIAGEERKIVININKEEIENNNDLINDSDSLNDTIELTKIIDTINKNNKNE